MGQAYDDGALCIEKTHSVFTETEKIQEIIENTSVLKKNEPAVYADQLIREKRNDYEHQNDISEAFQFFAMI